MKYYSDPDEMAIEFSSNMQKQNSIEQITQTLNNIHLLAQRNVQIIVDQFQLGQTDNTLTTISERLRNTSIIVALLKLKFPKDKQQKFKLLGQTLYENFTIFKKLIQWCEQNDETQKKQKGKKTTQLDIHLINTIRAYSEYINNELGSYFKPK
ncbi:unnamed protein product (macronuclear) [Paramecium tetraurelia]|uniref:Uncharacterized protein n=1 Tax=Paramecium tetraurelia TaxID=5888 RepID=A0D8K3_PARTE|nr:uncharacterized protein GSPATT00014316001 [Paramecium tetraurelia]CAK79370.1 unnamed protein product [Paramecium tetraurelia]|eukprot:XP_001446767.1 hypothetical protein (macronuclear) [Paramecium tetraurelia strain d4-2]